MAGGNVAPKPSKPASSAKSNGTRGPIKNSNGTRGPIKNSNGTRGPITNSNAQNKKAQYLRNKSAVNDIRRPSTYTSKLKKKRVLVANTGNAAAPPIIVYEYIYNENTGESESVPSVVMIPERDVVNLATEDIDAATITNLLFENIGANELVKFVRNDTIEGLNPYYNIISNLSDIRRRFNPSDLISEQITDIDSEGYSINIDNKIPDQEYLDAQGITDYVYIDEATGDLVVHVVNMKDSETVEVQIDTNGTIYEVNN